MPLHLLQQETRMSDVTELLNQVLAEYQSFYPARPDPIGDLSSLRLDPTERTKVVDTGICYRIAEWVCARIPGAEIWVVWRRYHTFDIEAVHCVVRYNGVYYDTTNQDGVEDWHNLFWIRKNEDDFVGTCEYANQEGIESFAYTKPSPFMDHLNAAIPIT